MIILDITLRGLPTSPNKSRYANRWTTSSNTKKWKFAVCAEAKQYAPRGPLFKAKLTFIRYSSRRPDYDNLVASFKACADGLKLAGVILDDKHDCIGVPTYTWEPAKAGEGRVRIIVESKVQINRTQTEEGK